MRFSFNFGLGRLILMALLGASYRCVDKPCLLKLSTTTPGLVFQRYSMVFEMSSGVGILCAQNAALSRDFRVVLNLNWHLHTSGAKRTRKITLQSHQPYSIKKNIFKILEPSTTRKLILMETLKKVTSEKYRLRTIRPAKHCKKKRELRATV